MPDDTPAPAPQPIVVQAPPTTTALTDNSAEAQVKAFQQLIPLLPQYAQTLTDIQRTQAPQISDINLQQQQVYGPQLIQSALDNLKLADPTGFQIRQTLGSSILDDLNKGRSLSDQQKRDLEQGVRAGQVSRGGGTGLSDSIEEAVQKYNLGENLYQNRLANAGSFLNGSTPQSSFGQLNQAGKTAPVGTQDVSGFSSQLFPSTNQLIGSQVSNYGNYANSVNALNSLNSSNYWNQVQNTSNPFLTGLSVAMQGAATGARLAA